MFDMHKNSHKNPYRSESPCTHEKGIKTLVKDQRNMRNSKFITFKYKNQNKMHRKHYLHALVVLGIPWGTSKP